MAGDKQQEIVSENKNKTTITPHDIQFYFKSSWYLLGLILVIEFMMMFALSRNVWVYNNLVLWVIRVVVFGFILYKISRRFKQLNLSLFGGMLGLETGIVVAIVKIIVNEAAQWTWFNLFIEPFYLLGLGAIIGFVFYSLNKNK